MDRREAKLWERPTVDPGVQQVQQAEVTLSDNKGESRLQVKDLKHKLDSTCSLEEGGGGFPEGIMREEQAKSTAGCVLCTWTRHRCPCELDLLTRILVI